jgi:hypothetical protein
MNLESYCELLGKEDFLAKEDICLVLGRVAKKLEELVKDQRGIVTNILDIERRLKTLEEKVLGEKRGLDEAFPKPEAPKRAKKEVWWAIKPPAPMLEKWININGVILHQRRDSESSGWEIPLDCECMYCKQAH